MPNLVVYVPADVARALDAKGVSEDIQRRACKEVLVGLADGGLGAGNPEDGHSFLSVAGASTPVASPEAATSRRTFPAPSPARSFRPDPKGKK